MTTKADHKSRRKTAGWERSMTRKLLTLTVLTSAMFLSVNGMEHDDCECHDDPSHSSDYPQHAKRLKKAANEEPTEVEKRLMLAHYCSDKSNKLAVLYFSPISTAFSELRGWKQKYTELLISNNYEKKILALITLKEGLKSSSRHGIEGIEAETYLKFLSDVNGVRGIMWAALYRCFRNGYPISMAGIMDGGVTEDEEANKAVKIINDESTDPAEVVSVIDKALEDAEVMVEIKKIQKGWQELFEIDGFFADPIVAGRGIRGEIASMDAHLQALQRAGYDAEGIRESSEKITAELKKLEDGGVFDEVKIQYWFHQITEKVSQITNTLDFKAEYGVHTYPAGFHRSKLDNLKQILEAFTITLDAAVPLCMAPDQDYIDTFLSGLLPDNKQSLLNYVRNDQMAIPSDADYQKLIRRY